MKPFKTRRAAVGPPPAPAPVDETEVQNAENHRVQRLLTDDNVVVFRVPTCGGAGGKLFDGGLRIIGLGRGARRSIRAGS